jgi:hypothetical protein
VAGDHGFETLLADLTRDRGGATACAISWLSDRGAGAMKGRHVFLFPPAGALRPCISDAEDAIPNLRRFVLDLADAQQAGGAGSQTKKQQSAGSGLLRRGKGKKGAVEIT